jgi:hypothetical protein
MTDYVFLVDVDRDEAIKAYEKGLADLLAIWPEVEAYCKEQDQIARDRQEADYQKERELKRQELANIRKVKMTERRALPKARWWHFTKYAWVPLPVSPITDEELDTYLRTTGWTVYNRRDTLLFSYMVHYEAALRNLDNRIAHVKMSALPTIRMDEVDAQVMTRWGDGTEVREIKKSVEKQGAV